MDCDCFLLCVFYLKFNHLFSRKKYFLNIFWLFKHIFGEVVLNVIVHCVFLFIVFKSEKSAYCTQNDVTWLHTLAV